MNLKCLGCRLNEAELETWAEQFQSKGHQIVAEADQADCVVFNSCAVTGDAVKKSRYMIRKIHRENPSAKLVVSGCYATLNLDEVAESLGVDLVIANSEKNRLVETVQEKLALETMPAFSTEPGAISLFKRGRQRAFVKVQDGCRYRCTFCIVTIARGEEVSRPHQEIIDEINRLHEQGIQEIVLTGVHLGGYGGECGSNLAQLIEAILENTAIPRLRLGSLEPWELSDGFFWLLKEPRLMPHLHLPLQSGSDSILRRMARRCKTSEFAELVSKARHFQPDINITTDIIVGFPGEGEAEWQETLDFVETIGFGHMHLFSYSKREGTKAAGLPDQVSDAVKKARSQVLQRRAERNKQAILTNFLGRTFPILWENPSDGKLFGYTPNFLRVETPLPETNRHGAYAGRSPHPGPLPEGEGDSGYSLREFDGNDLTGRIAPARLVAMAESKDHCVAELL